MLVKRSKTTKRLCLLLPSNNLKGDKEVVLADVQKDSLILCYASNNRKGDKRIVLAAI